ncbi:MAG: hypothetical protein KJO21_12195 [Verrucomicrobiae bacterium]|nr:hypothetical protein [Verrucomicrobiae bacterium]NNJ43980.1 hypothetical protein [Akkermansiaceae bacterium]
MPKSKTIEIDEVLSPKDGDGPTQGRASLGGRGQGASTQKPTPDNPFADFQKSLPWKARLTLGLTQGLMILRSKSWGKWVIVPAVILGILIAIPLGILFIIAMIIRSFLRSFQR